MNSIAALIIGFSGLFKSDCIGEEFFLKRSSDFVSGLNNICFEMKVKDIKENIQSDQLSSLYYSYLNQRKSSDNNFWIDNLNFQNWFNDGGNCCFSNMYYPTWIKGTRYEVLGEVTSTDYGIQSLYFGNKERNDTLVVFTFYGGKSNKFYAISNGKYEKSRRVRGLFDITMKIDDFYSKYCSHVLDSIGYSRPCSNTIAKNCTEENGGREGRTIVRTSDKNVIVIFDPLNRKVHLRDAVFMNSLTEALEENLQNTYEEFVAKRTKDLDK